jgi:hypothetical protein
MAEQSEFEAWAMTKAHEIMMREGLQLALSAQNLDRRKVRSDSFRLRQAIADCLLETRGLAPGTEMAPDRKMAPEIRLSAATEARSDPA